MELLHKLIAFLRDPSDVIKTMGYPVLMLIIFAETGLLIGFFLPGDSLLVTTGALIQGGWVNPLELSPFVNLLLMNAALMAMAIVGDATGFAFGYRAGPKLFKRDQSFLFRKDRLLQAQRFYEKHGGKAIIMARFMPFVRTFAPIVAGIGKMQYRRFLMFNIIGGVAWVVSMTFLGFFLGKIFDAKQIERVVYLIIFLSIAPLIYGWIKSRFGKKDPEKDPAAKDPAEA